MQRQGVPNVDPKQLRKTLLTWGTIAVVIVAGSQIGWSVIWNEGLIRPMLNLLLFLYTYLGQSFIIAIAALTILLKLITSPLQIKQIRSTQRMAALQPRLAELKAKYGGNQQKMAEGQQKLYKQEGISPLGGCLPTLIQFPIWISLYQSINSILADTPLELMTLGKNIYAGFAAIADIVPLQSHFLWLDLAKPDPTPYLLPILVGGSMWLQQRMMAQPSSDPQQASMNQSMQIMMPVMFGFFTLQFASGLAIYFIISNIVGIIMQWAIQRLEGPSVSVATGKAGTVATLSKGKTKNGQGKKRIK